MTKLAITVNSHTQIEEFNKIPQIERYIVGNEKYAVRIDKSFNLEDIKIILDKAHQNQKKVYILINKIFHQHEIKDVENYLRKLSLLEIDGIIFGDLGIKEIIEEIKFKIPTVYSTGTTVTNSYFTDFAKELDIDEVELTNGLTMNEIKEIAKTKKTPITVPIHGAISMYYSPRDLVDNYQTHLKKENDLKLKIHEKKLYLYDDERDAYYYLHKNQYGTHLLSSEFLTGLRFFKELLDNDIDYLFIDTFTYENEEILANLKIYLEVWELAVQEKYTKEKYKEYFQKLKAINPERKYSTGFLMKKTIY